MKRRSVALHQGRGIESEHLGSRAEVRLELNGIGAQQKSAVSDVASGKLDVPEQSAALGFAIELRRLVGFVDKSGDVAHKSWIYSPFDRDRRDNGRDNRRDRGDQRKQGDEAAVQSGAGASGSSRSAQSHQLDRDQDDKYENDRPIAQQEDRNHVRCRQDRGKAGEHEKCRDRQDEGRPHRDEAEPACWTAVVIGHSPACARARCRNCQNTTNIGPRPIPTVAMLQRCCLIETFWRRRQRKFGMPRRFRSRILLRSVLRLRPRISAAFIWFPRVSDRVAAIRGASRSCKTR